MYYQIKEGKIIDLKDTSNIDNKEVIGVLTLKELEKHYKTFKIGDTYIKWCKTESTDMYHNFEIDEHFSYAYLNVVNFKDIEADYSKVAFITKNNLCLIILINDEKNYIKNNISVVIESLQGNANTEHFISRLLSRFLDGGIELIDKYDNNIMNLEKELLDQDFNSTFSQKIFNIKKRLTVFRRYVDNLVDFAEMLEQSSITTDIQFSHLNVFINRADRLINNIKMLLENLAHLQDSYQAELDYSLNNIMKIFTVVTTIFLPLTLIVGWYGMNFRNMPELNWKYGYLSVIIISILIVIACCIFFKKKKLFK